jgi:hypothetical protein
MEDEHGESRPPVMRKVNTRRRTLATEKMSAVRRKRREAWGLGWGICEILSTLSLFLFRFQGSGIG